MARESTVTEFQSTAETPRGGEVHRPLEFRKAGVVEGIGEPALAMHPPG